MCAVECVLTLKLEEGCATAAPWNPGLSSYPRKPLQCGTFDSVCTPSNEVTYTVLWKKLGNLEGTLKTSGHDSSAGHEYKYVQHEHIANGYETVALPLANRTRGRICGCTSKHKDVAAQTSSAWDPDSTIVVSTLYPSPLQVAFLLCHTALIRLYPRPSGMTMTVCHSAHARSRCILTLAPNAHPHNNSRYSWYIHTSCPGEVIVCDRRSPLQALQHMRPGSRSYSCVNHTVETTLLTYCSFSSLV